MNFYENLAAHSAFDDFAESKAYSKIPNHWFVGVADIANSTGEIDAGRYKVVNSVGAAVISAQINTHGGANFGNGSTPITLRALQNNEDFFMHRSFDRLWYCHWIQRMDG